MRIRQRLAHANRLAALPRKCERNRHSCLPIISRHETWEALEVKRRRRPAAGHMSALRANADHSSHLDRFRF
jgi:hypothetical protein